MLSLIFTLALAGGPVDEVKLHERDARANEIIAGMLKARHCTDHLGSPRYCGIAYDGLDLALTAGQSVTVRAMGRQWLSTVGATCLLISFHAPDDQGLMAPILVRSNGELVIWDKSVPCQPSTGGHD